MDIERIESSMKKFLSENCVDTSATVLQNIRTFLDHVFEGAMSIAGLLEHLTPFASELRSSNYHFYYPHKAFHKFGMQHSFLPTPGMQNQARK